MAINFKVLLHKEEDGGYWVEVPSLPGCVSQGNDKQEALRNIEEAILLHLESFSEYNEIKKRKDIEINTVSVGA